MTIIKNISAAFKFMTILPIPIQTEYSHLTKSLPWFPITGTVIGLIISLGYRYTGMILPLSISSVIAILIYILLTRGLHLDGLADTIDGFFSRKDRDTILKIMKEPTIGTFAALGLVSWFLLFYTCLPLLTATDLILTFSFARLSILWLPLFFSYPRESGTGKFFVENVNIITVLAATFITIGIMIFILFLQFPLDIKQIHSISPFILYPGLLVISIFFALLVGMWSKQKIGGITGDTMGFTIECSQIIQFLIILLILKQ